jgi:serine protease
MGIIGALGTNDLGLSGMIPDGNVCYLIGKALDYQGLGYVSDILGAIEWAVENGANVINLSLVISGYLQSTNQLFDDLYYNQNRIVVAASGNNGPPGQYMYPAAYSSVVSVASVDEDSQVSWFSQRNNRVDLSAFGRNIISTVPLSNAESLPLAVLTMEQDNSRLMGIYSERSTVFDTPTSGPLVECPRNGDTGPCPGPGGHICLIKRYVSLTS